MIKAAIIIAALPVLAYPALLSAAPESGSVEIFLMLYPVYVLVATICAWICRERRPEISWILVIIMLLTHAAMWLLVCNPPQ
ncbi:MAG: hypothetical protein HDS65_09650 [Bacteroidales bacterium]|nr:hypothetical protein [Bacteroidales bacterium]